MSLENAQKVNAVMTENAKILQSGGVQVGKVTYHGNAVVPNTNGKTANQLQQELRRQYRAETGKAIGQGRISGSFEVLSNGQAKFSKIDNAQKSSYATKQSNLDKVYNELKANDQLHYLNYQSKTPDLSYLNQSQNINNSKGLKNYGSNTFLSGVRSGMDNRFSNKSNYMDFGNSTFDKGLERQEETKQVIKEYLGDPT